MYVVPDEFGASYKFNGKVILSSNSTPFVFLTILFKLAVGGKLEKLQGCQYIRRTAERFGDLPPKKCELTLQGETINNKFGGQSVVCVRKRFPSAK